MKTNAQNKEPGFARSIPVNTLKIVSMPAKGAVLLTLIGIYFHLLAVTSAAGTVTSISPDVGTIGTTFTVAGLHLGAKQGTVFLGPMPCQVLAWGDTSIQCLIKTPIEAGEYDVVLNPQGASPRVTLPRAFIVMPPMLAPPERRPYFVSPGERVTVKGAFFGEGAGREQVIIEDFGERAKCAASWSGRWAPSPLCCLVEFPVFSTSR